MNDQNKKSSKALALIIVANRSLGMFKQESRNAMIELAKRKENGDNFDYEKFIKEELDRVPKTNVNPEVTKFLSSLSFFGNKSTLDKYK